MKEKDYPTLVRRKHLAEQEKVILTFRLKIGQVNMLRREEIAKSLELFLIHREEIKKSLELFVETSELFIETSGLFMKTSELFT